jgi:hypothetical protein
MPMNNDTDPYTPPQTPPSSPQSPPIKRGRPLMAVAIALVVDFGATIILSIVVTFLYLLVLAGQGVDPEAALAGLSRMGIGSPLTLLLLAGGCLITIFSGYLCAKIAGRDEVTWVTVYALIAVAIGFILGSLQIDTLTMILIALNMGCAYGGGWLYMRKKLAAGG